MKSNPLAVYSLLASLVCVSVSASAQEVTTARNTAAQHAMTDEQSIEGVMKKLFDKPTAPLKVAFISIDGDYALAGWIQDQRGGRALLKKVKSQWSIEVCGGDGLKQAATLAMTGMPPAAANRLAAKLTAAEKKLPAEQVKKFALFEGMVKVDGGADEANSAHHHPGAQSK